MKNQYELKEIKDTGKIKRIRIRFSKCSIHGQLNENTVVQLFKTKSGKKYHKFAICYSQQNGEKTKRISKKHILIQYINSFEEKKEKFDLFFKVSNKIKNFNQLYGN